MTSRNVLLILASVSGSQCFAANEVKIEEFNGSSELIFTNFRHAGQSGDPISVNSATRCIQITTVSSSDNIGALTFTNGPSGGGSIVSISFGTAFFSDGRDPSQTVGTNLAGLSTTGMSAVTVELYGKIGGDLNGAIDIDTLIRFDTVGAINAVITAAKGVTDVTKVVCQKVTSSGAVVTTRGNIFEVQTTGNSATNGEMAGLIRAVAGNIGTVTTVSGKLTGRVHAYSTTSGQGKIGSIDVGDEIDAPSLDVNSLFPIRARNGIDSIKATEIDALITTRADVLPFGTATGRIGSLETTTGDFSGTLACAAIGPASGSPQ